MRRLAIMLSAYALSSCMSLPDHEPPPVSWFTEPLIFETTSWGKPIQHFSVAPDGYAEVWNYRPKPGGGFHDYTVSKVRGRVTRSDLTGFETALFPYVSGEIRQPGECKDMITDAPSSWIGPDPRRPLIGPYFGCMDRKFLEYANPIVGIVDKLRDAIVLEAEPFETISYPPDPPPPPEE